MLPHRPRALDPDFGRENPPPESAAVPQRESEGADTRPTTENLLMGAPDASAAEHHSQICPTCGHRLTGHHCKLVCTDCGYYMSCADYY